MLPGTNGCVAALIAVLVLCGCDDTRASARRAESVDDRIARGGYLTEGLLGCFTCHSERDWEQPGAPPMAGRKGAGFVWRDDSTHRLVAPNLTPDAETGIGRWTDDQLGRAIREGVAHDGRRLAPAMPTFRRLSDEDLASVIAWLRALPPIHHALPYTALSAEEQAANDARESLPIRPLPLATELDPVERGRRLVVLGECTGCHTSWHSSRMPGVLAGGNQVSRAERQAFSTNITPHASGISYDADAFIYIMRSGKGGGLNGVMPWAAYRNLSDDDLRSIHAFLRTMQPVAHYIGNAGPATHCPVCGQEHPLGDLNRIEVPARFDIDVRILDDYVGTYHTDEYDFTLVVSREGDRLFANWDGAPPAELVPQSDSLFVEIGGVAPLRFARDGAGRVVHVLSLEPDAIVLERIR